MSLGVQRVENEKRYLGNQQLQGARQQRIEHEPSNLLVVFTASAELLGLHLNNFPARKVPMSTAFIITPVENALKTL